MVGPVVAHRSASWPKLAEELGLGWKLLKVKSRAWLSGCWPFHVIVTGEGTANTRPPPHCQIVRDPQVGGRLMVCRTDIGALEVNFVDLWERKTHGRF